MGRNTDKRHTTGNLMTFTRNKKNSDKKSYKLPDWSTIHPTSSTKSPPLEQHLTREKIPAGVSPFICNEMLGEWQENEGTLQSDGDTSMALKEHLFRLNRLRIHVSTVARESPPWYPHPLSRKLQWKTLVTGQPGWLSGLALPSAQGLILETRDWVPVGLPAWSLLVPLPVSLCLCLSASLSLSLSLSLSNK